MNYHIGVSLNQSSSRELKHRDTCQPKPEEQKNTSLEYKLILFTLQLFQVLWDITSWWVWVNRLSYSHQIRQIKKVKFTIKKGVRVKTYKKLKNEQYRDFACSHEPYYYLDLHELNFPDRDERGCGLVNMTVHVSQTNFRVYKFFG